MFKPYESSDENEKNMYKNVIRIGAVENSRQDNCMWAMFEGTCLKIYRLYGNFGNT